jgi:hypothetical protein
MPKEKNTGAMFSFQKLQTLSFKLFSNGQRNILFLYDAPKAENHLPIT